MRALVVALVMVATGQLAHADEPAPPAPAPVEPTPAPVPLPHVVSTDPATALREANAAATAGDWARVEALVGPLTAHALEPADLAEMHRLAGLAAFFHHQPGEAESHFVAYLKLDLDGHLDPALYPPEAVNFFNDVRAKHDAELKALRPKPRRYFVLSLLPPFGQFQNGERTKGIVVGSLLGALAITNVTTYLVIRSWCHNPGSTCDASGTDHHRRAEQLSTINALTGLGLIATYIYGVWDGVSGYRRQTREQRFAPYASPSSDGGVIGVVGSF